MHETMVPDLGSERMTLGTHARLAAVVLSVVGIVGMLVGPGLGWMRGDQWATFFHAYLVNFAFFLSISLGGLFFVALHHVTRAGWSVAIRRLAELLAATMPLLAVLFLPILVPIFLGSSSLYMWNNPEVVEASAALQHKAGYFGLAFFTVRAVLYFAVWWLLARFFLARSLQQDESSDPALTIQMERASPVALLLCAATVTFASFDWLMSLVPTWFSTIFGVYYFAGTTLGSLGAIILAAVALQASGRLSMTITTEHYHDLGKLLLGFIVFWGYIAFSQYMLIWYANLPEETVWYQPRQTGAWAVVSLALLFGQLIIPFFGLLSRSVKRRPRLLAFWALWTLVFHWLDMYWLVMPSFSPDRVPFGPIDVSLFAGLACLYLASLIAAAGQHSLLPRGDPRLPESLAFENH